MHGKLTEVLKAYVEHGARRPWPCTMSEYDSGVLIAFIPGVSLGFEEKKTLLLNLCLCGLGPVKNLCLCGLDPVMNLCLCGLGPVKNLCLCRLGPLLKPMSLRAGSFTTIDVERGSFDVQFKRQELDHAFVSSTLLVEPLVLGPRDIHKEQLKILRPGLGSKIARKPGEKESCAQKQHGHTYCGKDYTRSHACCQAWAPFWKTRVAKLYFVCIPVGIAII